MGKTWGPFTGRQLTVMFCALIAGLVLIPSTVYAVDAFSNVAIQDPTSGVKAHVTAAGSVQVADASGPLTVDGTVTARDALAKDLVRIVGAGSGTSCQQVAAPPSGKAWILKSLAVNVVAANGTTFGPSQYIVVYPNTSCSYPYFAVMTPIALGHQDFSLDPGVAIPNGGAVSVALFNSSVSWELTAVGYAVPSSSVPAAAASPSSPAPASPRKSPDS